MPLADVLNWIDQIGPIETIKWISFTGGEAFIYPDLGKAVKKAKTCGKRVRILTNAFWATDFNTAKRTLQELMPSQISVTADRYHQEFIKLENVKNVIRACFDLGIIPHLAVLADDQDTVLDMKTEFGDSLNLHLGTRVEPVGRAAKNGITPTLYTADLTSPCEKCGRAVHVRTDGEAFFCCNANAIADHNSAFSIGNLHQWSLPEMLESIDPVLELPALHSNVEFFEVIEAAGLEQKLAGCRTTCELCCRMLADKAMRKAIKDHFEVH
jgi:hypothetical protein